MSPLSKKLLLIACVAIGHTLVHAHPDKVEDRLLFHFATGSHPPTANKWEDLTHNFVAEIKGAPHLTNLGPALALEFDGIDDHLSVPITPDRMPEQEFTVTAWVLLRDTQPNGGIVTYVQDDGPIERGFALGYDRKSFTFSVSSMGADQQTGTLTRIRSTSPLAVDRWYHVAGMYDGANMRLYVNGSEEATSTRQSGKIFYPATGVLSVGAFLDANEMIPMEGAIFEAKLYSRVLAPDELRAVPEKNSALVKYEAPINKNLRFVVAPFLQFGTRDSITLMCETTHPAGMVVEYGEKHPLLLRASKAARTNAITGITLSGLKPFQSYFYRVICTDAYGNIARSEIGTFQTAPDAKTAWAFGILGDTQRNPEITRKCADGIFALRPNLMIHLGDVVDDGFAKHQWVSELFEPCSKLFAHVPSFPVIGNHEKNAHWYYDYFSMPEPEYYYTFHYGNAQFFMIDSNKDLSPGSEQYKWLEKELRKSKATWKFAAHHHPCFSSDEDDYGDKWKGKAPKGYAWGDKNASQLVELYEKYGIDIAFAGHIHSYERTWPILQMAVNQKNGVRYIVSGGGGGGLEQAAPQRSWFTLHVQRGHHYCFASVQDRTIQFKAYDVEGRLFDTFELTKGRR